MNLTFLRKYFCYYSVLSIDSARPEDAGIYSVEVTNKLGDINAQAKVEIEPREKRPAFISDLQNTQVVEGFPVKFEIKVIGHPQPKLKWLHNGEEIKPDNAHFKLSQTPDGKASLIIGNNNIHNIQYGFISLSINQLIYFFLIMC